MQPSHLKPPTKTRYSVSHLLYVLLAFLLSAPLGAQINPLATEYCHAGEISLLEGHIDKALRQFKMATKLQPELAAAERGQGFCYEQLKDYRNALEHYLKVVEIAPKFSRALYYQIGDVYFKLGLYSRAMAFFDQFRRMQLLDELSFTVNGEKERLLEDDYLKKLNGNMRACQISLDTAKFREDIQVLNLGTAINTRADEYFPFLSNDQHLIFFTRRRPGADENLMVSTANANGVWTSANSVGNTLNSEWNEGMSTLVRDGRHLFFTACNRPGIKGPCDIWEADVEAEKILHIKPIEGFPNSNQWESQAAISCDGSELYFASNREGGLGGTDIWFSKRLSSGAWSDPINLGAPVNTPEDEEAPFISNDGNALYFSSTGHLGMGDQDLFVSFRNTENQWITPTNLGPKINTPHRELGFFLSADGKTAYFASDRPYGFGGMDIYRVQLQQELYSMPITFTELLVRDSLSDRPITAPVVLADGRTLHPDSTGRIFLCIPSNTSIQPSIALAQYHPYQRFIHIPAWDNRQFFSLFLRLQPIQTPMPTPPPADPEPSEEASEPSGRFKSMQRYNQTLYFRFDSDELEFGERDKLLDFLGRVVGKEILHVDINGFADDIGEDRYNLELSQKRAKRIALVLHEHGFPIDRIAMKGYGEIHDDKTKSQNRKVEIKITTLE